MRDAAGERAQRVPHKLAESAVSAVRGQGHPVAYMPYTDDSGGVVVGKMVALL